MMKLMRVSLTLILLSFGSVLVGMWVQYLRDVF